MGLVGVHPLRQRAAGKQLRRGRRVGGVLQRQGRNVQNGVLGSDYQPLHQVLQLAHVAGPIVLLQKSQKAGAAGEGLVVLPAEAGQELVGHGDDVLLPLPQGGDVDADDVQPVEEIGPEQTALHRLLQIAVGGNDQPEVQLDLLGAGEALNGLLLNQLQELGLDMGGQLADLIQEQRAVVGQLDLADLAGGGGPGEGALLIAEQL